MAIHTEHFEMMMLAWCFKPATLLGLVLHTIPSHALIKLPVKLEQRVLTTINVFLLKSLYCWQIFIGLLQGLIPSDKRVYSLL